MFRGVAQLVAHLVWDQGVAGSNPVTPTTKKSAVFLKCCTLFLCICVPLFSRVLGELVQ